MNQMSDQDIWGRQDRFLKYRKAKIIATLERLTGGR